MSMVTAEIELAMSGGDLAEDVGAKLGASHRAFRDLLDFDGPLSGDARLAIQPLPNEPLRHAQHLCGACLAVLSHKFGKGHALDNSFSIPDVNRFPNTDANRIPYDFGMAQGQTKPASVSPNVKADEARKLKVLWNAYKAANGGSSMTQDKFVALAGIGHQSRFSQYLNGHDIVNAEHAVEIARAFCCKVVDFSPRLASWLQESVAYAGGQPAIVARDPLERQLLEYYRDSTDEGKEHIMGASITAFNDAHPGTHVNMPFKVGIPHHATKRRKEKN